MKTNLIIKTRNSNQGFDLNLSAFGSIVQANLNNDVKNPNLNWNELNDEAIQKQGLLINTYTFTESPDFDQAKDFLDQNLNFIIGYLWRDLATDDDWDTIPEYLNELKEFANAFSHHNIFNPSFRDYYLSEIQKVSDYLENEIIG